jgi:hypothetical protein
MSIMKQFYGVDLDGMIELWEALAEGNFGNEMSLSLFLVGYEFGRTHGAITHDYEMLGTFEGDNN